MTKNARPTRDPRDIEAELERTRARMSDTLQLLESRISPGALFNQAWDYVRTKNDGQMTSNLRDTIARNPLPITLMGLALGWLMIAGRRGSVPSSRTSLVEHGEPATSMSEELQADVSSRIDNVTHGDQLAGVDEASVESSEFSSTAYRGSRSHIVESDDEVAEGLDEASPTSKKSGASVQERSSSTLGPSTGVDKGFGEAGTNSEKRTL